MLFTEIEEINYHVLYFMKHNNDEIINLFRVNQESKRLMLSIIPTLLDKLFADGLKFYWNHQNPVNLTIKLLEINELILVRDIITRIYLCERINFNYLFRKILDSKNLTLLELFFSQTPTNFIWDYDNKQKIIKYDGIENNLIYYKYLLTALIKTKQLDLLDVVIFHCYNYSVDVEKQIGILIETAKIISSKYKISMLLQDTQEDYSDIVSLI